jgi:hypothetical protein
LERAGIFETDVQELENMGMLQSHAKIQECSADGEDRPYEGTLEIVIFRDFVEHGLVVPISDFLHALL